jgi:hypothetical protein
MRPRVWSIFIKQQREARLWTRKRVAKEIVKLNRLAIRSPLVKAKAKKYGIELPLKELGARTIGEVERGLREPQESTKAAILLVFDPDINLPIVPVKDIIGKYPKQGYSKISGVERTSQGFYSITPECVFFDD